MLLEKLLERDAIETMKEKAPPTEQPIRLVKTTQQGSSFAPNGFELTIEVVGTGHHVGLNMVPSSRPDQKWDYDFANLRIVTADGVEVPNVSEKDLRSVKEIVQRNLTPLTSKKGSSHSFQHG